ncbi:hypothetical protein BC938DRAFT_484145 [Jimgerdemannia flammicorona]|uniref:Uncharacterized protein n=1 Tax=Jimgerdemannia flammicorona TaxID=994334 RepID=A0A433QVC5_9FUNG|nr:hypothetical protein BC938DRAFT_484145 [Jimgerdemannia flammicorona]
MVSRCYCIIGIVFLFPCHNCGRLRQSQSSRQIFWIWLIRQKHQHSSFHRLHTRGCHVRTERHRPHRLWDSWRPIRSYQLLHGVDVGRGVLVPGDLEFFKDRGRAVHFQFALRGVFFFFVVSGRSNHGGDYSISLRTLLPSSIYVVVGMEKLSIATSFIFFYNSISVFGPTIAGSIQQIISSLFLEVIVMWTGVAYFVSFLFTGVLRLRMSQGKLQM